MPGSGKTLHLTFFEYDMQGQFPTCDHDNVTLTTRKLRPSPIVAIFGRKEGNVLFNDALNTFYLRLYGVGHMINDHSDSERENPLLPHGLLFPISSKGSFICTIP